MTKNEADVHDSSVDGEALPTPRKLRVVVDYETVLRSLATNWPRAPVAHELAALEAGAKALAQLRKLEPPGEPVETVEAHPSPCPLCGGIHTQPFECELTRLML